MSEQRSDCGADSPSAENRGEALSALHEAAAAVLEKLPEDAKPQAQLLINLASTSISGPTPPPEYLVGYDHIYPGFAKAFLDDHLESLRDERARRHAREDRYLEHAIACETRQVDGESRLIDAQIAVFRRGQWLAVGIAAAGMVSGTTIAAAASPSAGAAVIVAGSLMLAAASHRLRRGPDGSSEARANSGSRNAGDTAE